MKKAICVFCGARDGLNPAYISQAKQFGAALAKNNITLVYGGASIGVMGAVAQGCLDGGGEVIGVIPQAIIDLEVAATNLTQIHIVNNMHERKQKMHDLSDGFVCLPGGIGTLDEFFETATWKQLKYHQKPIGFLDTNNYYSNLFQTLRFMQKEGFVFEADINSLHLTSSVNELINKMTDSII